MQLASRRGVRPDRVLYPATGFTKKQAIDYYKRAAKFLLPHLKNVPLSFKRYPDTVRGESFWEKDAPSFTPRWVKTIAVPRRAGESDIHYVVVNDVKTLTWLVDTGGIELHPFLHRAPKLDVATSVVFDLDPGTGASIDECCEVALLLRDALGKIGFESLAKVSGSKGLQVYVPLNTNATHDTTEAFARLVSDELARAYPKLVVSKMAKQLRARRVFIDWSQNADYKTTVAVYSLRAKRESPFVSMPLTWTEVARHAPLEFTPDAALKRLARKGDLFAPVLRMKQ
jgi:bifunctional non-homologous end joining protein LigD